MDSNENIRSNTPENVIVLGVASIETQGGGSPAVEMLGEQPGVGISEA